MMLEGPNSANYAGAGNCCVFNSPSDCRSNAAPAMKTELFSWLFVDGHVQVLHDIDTVGKGTLTTPLGMWTVDPSD